MKKIPTVFERDRETGLVLPQITPGCEWAFTTDEPFPTAKFDGTPVLIREFPMCMMKRRTIRPGKKTPPDFLQVDFFQGSKIGWVPVDQDGDKPFWEGLEYNGTVVQDCTYELVGPKVQGNPYGLDHHELIPHGDHELVDYYKYRDGGHPYYYVLEYLKSHRHMGCLRGWPLEGIVWKGRHGRKAKIKVKDFGMDWPP